MDWKRKGGIIEMVIFANGDGYILNKGFGDRHDNVFEELMEATAFITIHLQ